MGIVKYFLELIQAKLHLLQRSTLNIQTFEVNVLVLGVPSLLLLLHGKN